MRLGVQHPFIKTDLPLLTKQEIEILQRLRQPETLHFVLHFRRRFRYIIDSAVAVHSRRVVVDGFEHGPADAAPVLVAGYAVHVEDGFDGFGAVWVVSIGGLRERKDERLTGEYSFAIECSSSRAGDAPLGSGS